MRPPHSLSADRWLALAAAWTVASCADAPLAPGPPDEAAAIREVGSSPGGVAGFQLLAKFTAPGGPIAEIVAASPDGMVLVYTSSVDQRIGLLDISEPTAPTDLGTVDVASTVASGAGEPTSVAITPDGRFAVVAVKDASDPIGAADPGSLVFVDLETLAIAGTVAVGVGPDSVRITPDGALAVLAIEDEEDEDGNGAAQLRPGSIQIVEIDDALPAASRVTTIALQPELGNLPTDPQPEFVDVSADGTTAIVSLQENNLVAVVDLETMSVARFIDAGTSQHARADLDDDDEVRFEDPTFVGQLQPDGVCLLADGVHFVTANEGDTPDDVFVPGVRAGGRGFSILRTDGSRAYDSGDALEWFALRAGAYPDGRSDARGVEVEGCAVGRYAGAEYAFLLGERNAALFVVDVTTPTAPVIRQLLGAPMRPEGAVAIPDRGLVVVSGEGDDDTGGGVWIYGTVDDGDEAGHGPDVYDPRSSGRPFGSIGALAYDRTRRVLVAAPGKAFGRQRLWRFRVRHDGRDVRLLGELRLRDSAGADLVGHDPEGLAMNPEGGYVVASEGEEGNGADAPCVGSARSNRLLFFERDGRLDPDHGVGGVVDLPCGTEPNAIDWSTVSEDGFAGVTVADRWPYFRGGLVVYVAFARGLTTDGAMTRIGRYDVDLRRWQFFFYPLDAAGDTRLGDLIRVDGGRFAVLEGDTGWAGDAGRKSIRTFDLSSGAPGMPTDPVDPAPAVDLLAHPFRFDEADLEGLALGGGGLWVTNDNGGGSSATFFLRLDPAALAAR